MLSEYCPFHIGEIKHFNKYLHEKWAFEEGRILVTKSLKGREFEVTFLVMWILKVLSLALSFSLRAFRIATKEVLPYVLSIVQFSELLAATQVQLLLSKNTQLCKHLLLHIRRHIHESYL